MAPNKWLRIVLRIISIFVATAIISIFFRPQTKAPVLSLEEYLELCFEGKSYGEKTMGCDMALNSQKLERQITAEVYFERGRARRDFGGTLPVIDAMTSSIEADPYYAPAYALRAEVYRELGEFAKAEADLETYEKLVMMFGDPAVSD